MLRSRALEPSCAVKDAAVRLVYSFPGRSLQSVKVWRTCSRIARRLQGCSAPVKFNAGALPGFPRELIGWRVPQGGSAPQAELARLFLMGKDVSTCEMRLEGQLNQINYDLPSLYQAPPHTLGRENNDWLE